MQYEFEQKALIDKNNFNKLLNIYPFVKLNLVNYYFDTNTQFFKINNSALRIRSTNNSEHELTVKIKKKDFNEEYNFPIKVLDIDSIIKNKEIDLTPYDTPYKQKFSDLNINIIKITRYIFKGDDYILFLDETNFGNVIDFEIEVESYSKEFSKEVINNLLMEHNIVYQESNAKIARYFKYNK